MREQKIYENMLLIIYYDIIVRKLNIFYWFEIILLMNKK
jgi:hypothetical protein